MRKHCHTLILAGLFVSTTWLAHGQTDCSQALIQAERAYYTGRFNEVEALLGGCIANGFDKDQKTEAYKLIALSSILTKKFDQADTALTLMLKNNPQFEFAPQDPPEFRKRVEHFRVHPLVEIGFNVGMTLPFFKVTEVYDTRVLPSTTTYHGKTGYHAGIYAAFYFNKRVSIKGGYEWQGYSFSMEDANELNTALLTETQHRTQWLVGAGYGFFIKKISIQMYAGSVFSTLKKAEAYLVMDRANGSGEIDFSFNNLEQRTRHEVRPLLEVKLNVPFNNGWLASLNARYEHGLSNITNADNRYSSTSHSVLFEWVEDDFKGRYLILSLGISKQFYKVKIK